MPRSLKQLVLDFFGQPRPRPAVTAVPQATAAIQTSQAPLASAPSRASHIADRPAIPWTEHGLSKQLSLLANARVRVHINNNRHSMITAAEKRGVHEVRLHKMFLEADAATLQHLARFVTSRDRKSSTAMDAYIASHRHLITKPERPIRTRTRGRHHDLDEAYDRVCRQCFRIRPEAAITWGKNATSSRARSVALGSYAFDQRLIRIHPVLDNPKVPAYFLDWIVYHELLHHALPIERSGSRRSLHSRRFRTLEQQYPFYRQARDWEKHDLPGLLRSI